MVAQFQNEEMGDAVAVGAVTPATARIWIRTTAPGVHRVSWWPNEADHNLSVLEFAAPADEEVDNTHVVSIPDSGERLQPLTHYGFQVTSGDRLLGEGRFQTPPATAADTPAIFAFAIMSCNQPFDAEGNVRPDARQMLRAIKRALEKHDCKFVLFMGDQMYSDMPSRLSIFNPSHFSSVAPSGRERIQDCTTSEVRRLYHKRYRHFLSIPEFRAIVARIPSYPILDDHDIIDNWGSHPAHQRSEWRALGEGARWAYFDYQASLVTPRSDALPSSFQYEMTYGQSSIFVLDIRSERWARDDEGELFSAEQADKLVGFLDRTRDQKALFFVLSVPPVHLPRFLANTVARISSDAEDFSDRWSSLGHVDDLARFMTRIRSHQRENPHQRMVFLSGDIHVGCAHELVWHDGDDRIYQLVSSGMTNRVGKIVQAGARWLMRLNKQFKTRDGELTADVRALCGVNGRDENPYAALNIGIVQVRSNGSDARPTLEYFLYGHDGDDPVCVFQSPPM